MLKARILISIIVVAGAILRIFYSAGMPLGGNEVGVGILQATGQAENYSSYLENKIVPIAEVRKFISYSPMFDTKDVIDSLRYRGMHPPLYYLGMHYVLKYIGNDTFTLRAVSIVASLLCIVFMYRLGKCIYDEKTGLLCALFTAIAGYCVMYGNLVRPYPLAMLISLISTELAYRLNDDLNFRNKKLYLYIITAIAGLYTIYHFLFVFIFQITFLLVGNLKNKKALSLIAVIIASVFVCYLPWLPVLFNQLKTVIGGNYYFHGKSNLLLFMEMILSLNFLKFLPVKPFSIIKIFIAAMAGAGIVAGCLYSLKDKKHRILIIAFAVHLLCNVIADIILKSKTLILWHLFFFVIPISLLLFSVGVSRITNRYFIRTILILFFGSIMVFNSTNAPSSKQMLDGPRYIRPFRDAISKHLNENDNGLVMINTLQRRFLFSFAHAIREDVDMKIVRKENMKSEMDDIDNLNNYDFVFMVNCYMESIKNPFFSEKDVANITEHLAKYNFSLINQIKAKSEFDNSSLIVFAKNDN